jgi:flagellar export protein FliJ
MIFRSPLTALLRLRSSLERQAWLNLKLVNMQIAGIDTQITDNEQEIASQNVDRLQRLRKGLSSYELECNSVVVLRLKVEKLRQAKAELDKQRSAAEQEYRQRRCERESVETILDRQRHAHEYEVGRRETARVDEATLQRRLREKTSAVSGEQNVEQSDHDAKACPNLRV